MTARSPSSQVGPRAGRQVSASVRSLVRAPAQVREHPPEPGAADVPEPPGPSLAGKLCDIVRDTVEATADLEPASVAKLIEGTPRGLQHRRQIAMYLSHVVFGVRTADVARCFGRDTTTVYYAYRQVEDMRDDPFADAFLDAVERIVSHVHETARGMIA